MPCARSTALAVVTESPAASLSACPPTHQSHGQPPIQRRGLGGAWEYILAKHQNLRVRRIVLKLLERRGRLPKRTESNWQQTCHQYHLKPQWGHGFWRGEHLQPRMLLPLNYSSSVRTSKNMFRSSEIHLYMLWVGAGKRKRHQRGPQAKGKKNPNKDCMVYKKQWQMVIQKWRKLRKHGNAFIDTDLWKVLRSTRYI